MLVYVSALFIFSIWPTRNIDKTHLRIFSIFFSNLRVKSPIKKKIDNNIFEGMTYRFYILLLFDFQNKQNNVVNLNDV